MSAITTHHWLSFQFCVNYNRQLLVSLNSQRFSFKKNIHYHSVSQVDSNCFRYSVPVCVCVCVHIYIQQRLYLFVIDSFAH